MRYIKRKVYGLIVIALWLALLWCGVLIAGSAIPALPQSSLPLGTVVSIMYWIVPILVIFLILWYFAPNKPIGTGEKLTRRQKKMVAQALKAQKKAAKQALRQ